MKRFRRILVVPVTSGVEPPPALHEAVALAALSGAELRMLGHLDDPVPPEGGGPAPEESVLIRDAQRSTYRARLQAWAEHVGAPDMPIEVTSATSYVTSRTGRIVVSVSSRVANALGLRPPSRSQPASVDGVVTQPCTSAAICGVVQV